MKKNKVIILIPIILVIIGVITVPIILNKIGATNDTNGNPSSTKKGSRSNASTIESCPGCKFFYTTDHYAIEGSEAANDYSTDMPASATDDYTELSSSHSYFLGVIESTTNPGKIGRAFVCGVDETKKFCIEGYDASKWSDETNHQILIKAFGGVNCSSTNRFDRCRSGFSLYAVADIYGGVSVSDDGLCSVSHIGRVGCTEE